MTHWFQGLDQLTAMRSYPLEDWSPKDCGTIDILIDANGQWFHEGSPIKRPALSALFAKLLWRENNDYFIKTPVEKMQITVADAPFIATMMRFDDQGLWVITNFQDEVLVTPQNPIKLGADDQGFIAYIDIRYGLEARFSRSLCHELAGALIHDPDDPDRLSVRSGPNLVPLIKR